MDPQAGQLRLNRPQVPFDIEPVGFPGLGHQIADVQARRLAAADRLHQLRHQQIRQQRGVKTPRPQHDQIGVGDRFECLRQGRRPFGDAAHPHDRTGGMADLGFPFNPAPIREFRPELHVGVGGGDHGALHR